jgi:hypothetical protein
MSRKTGKEFEVIVQGKNSRIKLPIVAEDAATAEKLAEPIIRRRRLPGPIIETKEKPKKP